MFLRFRNLATLKDKKWVGILILAYVRVRIEWHRTQFFWAQKHLWSVKKTMFHNLKSLKSPWLSIFLKVGIVPVLQKWTCLAAKEMEHLILPTISILDWILERINVHKQNRKFEIVSLPRPTVCSLFVKTHSAIPFCYFPIENAHEASTSESHFHEYSDITKLLTNIDWHVNFYRDLVVGAGCTAP